MGNISVIPTLLKHRIDKSGKSQIVIRVYIDRKVACDDSTHKKIEPAHWDDDRREVKKSAPNSSALNMLIKKRVSELEQQFLQSEVLGQKLTKTKLKKMTKGEDPGRDFLKFCTDHVKEKYAGDEHKETRRTYKGEITKLGAFQKEVAFGDIDFSFLTKYKTWLKEERKNSHNTIWKSLKFLNTMLNDAIKVGGYIKSNPFEEFDRGTYKQGERDYLDISDCDKIHNLLKQDIPDRLRLVGIYYLFMCYTGFRFQDATKFFNYDEHVVNDERIVIDTQKFGVDVNLLIHNRLREVLNFVKCNPLNLSNKEFNSYTKVLATMAGIKISITAHTGRHTFGATLAELNVPIERAQKLLGHKDKRSTEIYYHIKNKSLDAEMLKWNQL